MAISSKTIVSLFLLLLLQVPPCAEAQDLKTESVSAGYSALYAKNRFSAQFVAGALFSPISWIQDYPTFNYAQTNLRFGWMVNDPSKSRYFGTGNFELLFELTNSVIFEGFGTYIRGFTLLGRYNLLLPDPRWALYFQLGALYEMVDTVSLFLPARWVILFLFPFFGSGPQLTLSRISYRPSIFSKVGPICGP